MAKNYRSCVPSYHLDASSKCTPDLAKKMLHYFNISISIAACGIPHDLPEFALYGGPVACNNPPMVG